MHQLEARIQRLERSRSRQWLVVVAMLSGLPLLMALAGNGLISSDHSAVSDRVVTRSLVIVDESNRPRIGLSVDEEIGSSIFIRDETGRPAVSLAALNSGGSISILNEKGKQVAVLSSSGSGDGLLRLSDSQGRTVARVGRWAAEEQAGIKFYQHEDPAP